MPEGDTVWRTAGVLHAALAGKTLTACDIRVPRYATVDLSGDIVDEVVSVGKHLLIRVAVHSVHTHLKMEGSWRIHAPGSRWQRPAHQARIILRTDTVEAVGFSLGIVELLRRTEEHRAIGHLGPDLLGPGWNAAEAVRRLLRDPARPIGLALLDQSNLAGIGNIYRTEVCFLRKVDPRTPVGDIADLPGLVDEAHRVLTQAAHHPPWRPLAYGRARMPCQRCGTAIVRHLLGTGRERGVYVCPRCQPGWPPNNP